MLKNANYQQKFEMLSPWMNKILETVKKDLKQEHLARDTNFVKQNFPGKNPQKLTTEELAPVYLKVLIEGAEEIGDFISNRWLLKNTDVYHLFEKHLAQTNPQFSEIEELDRETSLKLIEESSKQFGEVKTYIFSVMNSVVFPKDVYQKLKDSAQKAADYAEEEAIKKAEVATLEGLKFSHEVDINRLKDRYEKKLQGMQKKYLIDVESLKKQIVQLQKKLQK